MAGGQCGGDQRWKWEIRGGTKAPGPGMVELEAGARHQQQELGSRGGWGA